MASVFAFGLAVIDFVYRMDKLPNAGTKYFTTDSELIGGGCAANAAIAIRKLGGSVSFGTRVGRDAIGDIILDELNNYGMDLDLVDRREGARSSYSSVAIDRNGERQIINFRGAGLTSDSNWIEAAPECDAYLTDTIWPPGAQKTLELARKRDAPGIVDVEALDNLDRLKSASHIAFSSQGLADLTGISDPVEGLREVSSVLSCWLAVTAGERGVFILESESIENIPAFPITPVDTLAAGDVWHGAFAIQIAKGVDEIQAAIFANAVAAIKCSRPGGRQVYPNASEVAEFMRANESFMT